MADFFSLTGERFFSRATSSVWQATHVDARAGRAPPHKKIEKMKHPMRIASLIGPISLNRLKLSLLRRGQ
jgi:hypothetical protein